MDNNSSKCSLIIKDQKYPLTDTIICKKSISIDYELIIKIIGINNISDGSYMFSDCNNLKYIKDISNWYKVSDINHMFSNCDSLAYIDDISKFHTSNIINMSYLFFNCKYLKRLSNL